MSEQYKKKGNSYKKRLGRFKPKFSVDLNQSFESEPKEKVDDVTSLNEVEQNDVEEILRQMKKEVGMEGGKLQDYEVKRKVGAGASGEVYRVLKGGVSFAQKRIPYDAAEMSARVIGSELLALHGCRKVPGIVGLESFFYEEGIIYLHLEYMNCGDLSDVVKTCGPLPERVIAQIGEQVFQGLIYLHNKLGIVHRDIKPGNILVNDKGEAKIADFGMAGMRKKVFNTFLGTLIYMSPERVQGMQHSFNSDCWSVGLTLLEMAVGKYPFTVRSTNLFDMLQMLQQDIHNKKVVPDNFSDDFKDFIERCLVFDDKDRPEAEELLKHPFIVKNKDTKPSFRGWLHKNYIAEKKRLLKKRAKKKE